MDAVNAETEHAPARSASSSTRNADLPPSSKNTFLMVAAPSLITLRPVAVDPVNETMSTRGSLASSAPTPWSLEVTMLTTPGGKSVCSAMSSPSTRRAPGCVRGGLQHDGVSGGQRGPDLGEVDLVREVPRGDRADDADGLPGDGAPGGDAHRRRLAEILVPLVGLGGIGREAQIVDRAFQLGCGGEHPRRADLGDGDLAQFLECAARIASRSWRTHRTRSSVLRDQSVSSKARRAASMARPMSSASASAAAPSTSSVAGLIGGEGAPAAAGQLAVDEQSANAVGQQCHLRLRAW